MVFIAIEDDFWWLNNTNTTSAVNIVLGGNKISTLATPINIIGSEMLLLSTVCYQLLEQGRHEWEFSAVMGYSLG